MLLYVQNTEYNIVIMLSLECQCQCRCLDLPGPLVEGVGVELPLDHVPGVGLVTVDHVRDIWAGGGRPGLDHVDCDGLRCRIQTVHLLLALALIRLGLVDWPDN